MSIEIESPSKQVGSKAGAPTCPFITLHPNASSQDSPLRRSGLDVPEGSGGGHKAQGRPLCGRHKCKCVGREQGRLCVLFDVPNCHHKGFFEIAALHPPTSKIETYGVTSARQRQKKRSTAHDDADPSMATAVLSRVCRFAFSLPFRRVVLGRSSLSASFGLGRRAGALEEMPLPRHKRLAYLTSTHTTRFHPNTDFTVPHERSKSRADRWRRSLGSKPAGASMTTVNVNGCCFAA